MYNHSQKVHFVGIGGVGMAGIAEVLITLNYIVTGSDLKPSALTDHLRNLGADIAFGHRAENVSPDVTTVVISSAVKSDNPEVIAANKLNIPVIPRAEMLAELMRMKYGIAMAGSHGKTSTTSMCAHLLKGIGLDPTVIIGGRVLSDLTGASLGAGQYLVAEADESDGSFCLLRPAIAVVTNIDAEHMSFYRSFGALEEAFLNFMNSIPFYGVVAYCGDDPVLERLAQRMTRRKISFGLSPAREIYAHNIRQNGFSSEFDLVYKGEELGTFKLPLPGAHMVSNSLGAIGVALELGAYPDELREILATFPGVARRSEKVGEFKVGSGTAQIIDDYGHHPSEIRATLRAIKGALKKDQNEDSRIHLIFQAHRYTRTKELFSDFLTCFEDADTLILSEIYSAGETPIEGITGELLANSVQHDSVRFISELEGTLAVLAKEVAPGDIIMTMGAGSIGKFSKDALNYFQSVDL